MIFLIAFGILAAAYVALGMVQRRQRAGRPREALDEKELETLSPYANFGGLVGQAHLRNAGLEAGEEPPVREGTEPVKFRL